MSVHDADKPVASGPVWQILQPVRGQLLVAALLAAFGAVLALAPLAGIAHIGHMVLQDTSSVSVPSVRHDIAWTLGLSLLSMFAGLALILGAELVAHLADNRLTSQLRLAAAQRLSQVPLGWFNERASGEVKQAMQDDIDMLHSLTAHFYTAVGRASGAILGSALYLVVLDWRMALVSLLPFPVFFLFLRRVFAQSGANMQDFAARLARMNGATTEFINGIPVVKAFGTRAQAHAGFRQAVNDFSAAFAAFTRPLVSLMAHAHALVAPVTVLGLVLLFGTLFVAQGWLAAVELLPFALVAPGMCAPVLLLHTLLHDLQGASGAAQRVISLLQTPVLAQPDAGRQQRPAGHEVRFEQVSHAYGAGYQALNKVSVTLAPGTVTAVVGSSGAGKSTLARLLLRFFDPDEGRITLGGVDLRQMDFSTLYQHLGFVMQEVRLIHASVRENIALGSGSASQQDIERAARAAHIHERIQALPRGYDAVIGEDALLSGGERQRLSIARAILLNAPVLVLDEATAAADVESEAAIQDALSHFAPGRTLLVIAHRLNTIMHADQILVLEQGTVVEQGSHQQLLARGGRYARLWALGGYDTEFVPEEVAC